jgi:hypothetical protein
LLWTNTIGCRLSKLPMHQTLRCPAYASTSCVYFLAELGYVTCIVVGTLLPHVLGTCVIEHSWIVVKHSLLCRFVCFLLVR